MILQETLEVEMQGLLLIAEEQKHRRRDFGLRHVVDAHRSSFGIRRPLQIHIFLQPAVQFTRGDLAIARSGHLIDQRVELLRAVASLGGKKHDWRVAQELEFLLDHLFIFRQQFALIDFAPRHNSHGSFGGLPCSALGSFRGFVCGLLCCCHGKIPLVHHNDHGAAGLLRIAGDGGVALRDALFSIDYQDGHVSALQPAARHHHA